MMVKPVAIMLAVGVFLSGRAGEALGISLMAGFVGGLFGLILLTIATEPMAAVALAFPPPAYCALGILGLSVIASLSGDALSTFLGLSCWFVLSAMI